MKILAVIAHLDKRGGQQTQAVNLLKELSKKHEVKLLMLRHKGSPKLKLGFPTEYVGELKFPSGVFALKKRIDKIADKFDVIHCFDSYYGLLAIISSGKRNCIVRIGMDPVKDLQIRGRWIYATIMSIVFYVLYSFVGKVAVNSPALIPRFKRFNPVYVPNGYDVKLFSTGKTKSVLRKELKLPQNKKILIYTGKIIPRKNLQAVFSILDKLPEDVLFLVMGKKNEDTYGDAYYRHLTKRFNNVMHKVMFIDEKPLGKVIEYMNAADIFVFPSKLEGTPNSVIEAMAAKLPIVCSDIPAHKFVNGKNGLMYKNKDELLGYLMSLVKSADKRKKFGSSAYEYVKKTHDIKLVVKKYEGLYEKIICRRKK